MRLGVLTRYLIRVHVGPFLFALSAITGLLFLNAVAQRAHDLMGKGLPWTVVGQFMLLSLPHTVALSLPMAVLVAVLYAFSELTTANEITAMSAGGIRPARVLMPLLAMGAVLTGVMLYFNDRVLPDSNHELKNLLLDIGRKSPTLELREQVVNEIKTESGTDRYYLTASRIDPVANTLEDITIFDANDPDHQRTTHAARGVMSFNAARTDLYLTLYDGVVNEVQAERQGGFQRVYFDRQIVPLRNVGNELERRLGGTDRGDREMGFRMLADNAHQREAELDTLRMESREKARTAIENALGLPVQADTAGIGGLEALRPGGPTVSRNASFFGRDRVTQEVVTSARSRASRGAALLQRINQFDVEFHKKLAIAFACLVFTLVGPPLALRFPRGGVGMVVGASSVIFSIYWVGLIAGESLADRRVADPAVTMWLSNVVFLILGLVLASRMGRAGSTVRGGGRTAELWYAVRSRLEGRTGPAARATS